MQKTLKLDSLHSQSINELLSIESRDTEMLCADEEFNIWSRPVPNAVNSDNKW